jgi:thiamine-monophosphate kinase
VSGRDPGPGRPRLGSSPEFDLIAAIAERMEATLAASGSPAEIRVGIGDDAAVTVPPGATATTVDALVDGVAFRRRWCPPRSVGRKALAAALSDLAAMGARPGEAYVWLGRPDDFDQGACLELAEGLADLAAEHGVAVLGGDLTASPALSVCVTAVGHAGSAEELVGRSGAEPGCALCVTGELGGAAAGLMLLEHDELAAEVPAAGREAAVARQLEPAPRLAAGAALAAAGTVAMVDLSDGLGADARHLAAASGAGVEIELDRLPLAAGVREVAAAAGRDPLELAASGGEDYELLCAIPRGRLAAATDAVCECGTTLTEVGRVVSGGSVRLRLPGGRSVPVKGHDHLRGR